MLVPDSGINFGSALVSEFSLGALYCIFTDMCPQLTIAMSSQSSVTSLVLQIIQL